MPQPETSSLHDYAVVWEASGYDENGETIISAPVEIRCRWENAQSSVVSPDGRVIGVEAIAVVTEDIKADSIIWQGRYSDRPTTSVSADQNPLMQVIATSKIEDVRGRVTRRVLKLQRYRSNLPASA